MFNITNLQYKHMFNITNLQYKHMKGFLLDIFPTVHFEQSKNLNNTIVKLSWVCVYAYCICCVLYSTSKVLPLQLSWPGIAFCFCIFHIQTSLTLGSTNNINIAVDIIFILIVL